MTQKVAVVTGVLNKRSISYGIVKAMLDKNIQVICLVQPQVMKQAQRDLDDNITVLPCDVEGKLVIVDGQPQYDEADASIDSVVDYVRVHHGKIQYLVHSIAHSDKNELEGDIHLNTRTNFHHTMEVSCFSFVRLALKFEPLLDDKAAITTMTFRGSSATAGSYFMMGLAKAALESAVRYLAQHFGLLNGTRVTAIAPGPVKTMAAMGIGDFKLSYDMGKARSFTGENPDSYEVGRTTLSIMDAEGITAAIIPVDNGIWDGVGMGTTPQEQEIYRLGLEALRNADKKMAAE